MFSLGFPLFGGALLVAVLAASRYLLGPEVFGIWVKTLTSAVAWTYGEIKDLIGTVSRRGWRPLIPWMLIALMGVIIWRIAMGLPLPQVPELATALVPLAGASGLMGWFRSREALQGVANSVSDAMNVTFGRPADVSPAPAQ